MANLVAPEIPGAYNPALTLLAGYAAVASINNRRHQMDLAAQRAADNLALQQAKFGLDQKEAAIDSQYKAGLLDVKQKALEGAAENLKFKQGLSDEQQAARNEMMNRVNSLDVPKHSPEWRDKIGDILLESGGAALSPEYKQLQSQLKAEKDPAFRTRQITFDTRLENLGVDKRSLYKALENPDMGVKTDPAQPSKVFVYTGTQFQEKTDPQTGVKFYAEIPVFTPFEKGTWQTLQKGYSDLYPKTGNPRPEPQPTGKSLDVETATKIVNEIKGAHPDWDTDRIKAEARITAQRNGYDIQ